jgi:hypothetical protein
MTKTAHLRKYDVVLLMDSTTMDNISADDKNLPTDTHVVTYMSEGNKLMDAVRSYKMTDIFDAYYDFGIKEIISIVSGFGTIKPKLYNPDKQDEKNDS